MSAIKARETNEGSDFRLDVFERAFTFIPNQALNSLRHPVDIFYVLVRSENKIKHSKNKNFITIESNQAARYEGIH